MNTSYQKIALATGFLWLVMVTGCARQIHISEHLFYPQTFDVAKRILVIPFENLTPFPEAGLIVSDLVADELRAWQGYEVFDRHVVEGRARTGEYALPLHWSRAEGVRFGRHFNADAVVVGTIVEFGYLREHRGLTETATFALAARIVSTQSGRVIWSGTMLGTAGSDLSPSRPPLMDVTGEVLQLAFGRLFKSYEMYREQLVLNSALPVAETDGEAEGTVSRVSDDPSLEDGTGMAPGDAPDKELFGLEDEEDKSAIVE